MVFLWFERMTDRDIPSPKVLPMLSKEHARYHIGGGTNSVFRPCAFVDQTVRIRVSDRAHSSIYYREYIDYIETREKRRSPAAHAAVVQLFLLRKEVQPVSSKYNQRSTIKRIQQLSSTNETFHRPKPNTSRSSNRHPRTVPMPPMPALSYKLTALLSSDRR